MLCNATVRNSYIQQLVSLGYTLSPICQQSSVDPKLCLDHFLVSVETLVHLDKMFLDGVLVSRLLRESLAKTLVKMIQERGDPSNIADTQNQAQLPDIVMSLVLDFFSQLSWISDFVNGQLSDINVSNFYGVNIPGTLGYQYSILYGINIPTVMSGGFNFPGTSYGLNLPHAFYGYGINIPTNTYTGPSMDAFGINIPTIMGEENNKGHISVDLPGSIGLNLTTQSGLIGFLLIENSVSQVFDQWRRLTQQPSGTNGFTATHLETILRQFYGNDSMDLLAMEIKRTKNHIGKEDELFNLEVLRMLKLNVEDTPSLIGDTEENQYAAQKQVLCRNVMESLQCIAPHDVKIDNSSMGFIEETAVKLLSQLSVDICRGTHF